jgi:hypothetical protein
MITQHTTVFHCQSCGRVVYQPRGVLAPVCCCEPMVCAIADMVREIEELLESREFSADPGAPAHSKERVAV